jgi:acetolactate synthase-1/2/3 large subunit
LVKRIVPPEAGLPSPERSLLELNVPKDANTHELTSTGRRRFIGGSLVGAAGAVVVQAVPAGAQGVPASLPKPRPAGPSPWLAAAESRSPGAEAALAADHVEYPGSDFMVDCMKAARIDYVTLCPGSSFRGLQESLQSYDGAPTMIVCTHEEISAAICHGYFKVAGKPMACLVHSNVGLQHASMAMFNAWCDRAAMMVVAGNVFDATKRRPGVEWYHTAQDLGAMVRDFVKYDDAPASLQHYAESFMRAQSIAMTAPAKPVLIVADGELQEESVQNGGALRIPKLSIPVAPAGDARSLATVARWLVGAKSPVIVADRAARTPEGMALLVKLAESLNAPVVDLLGRLNFPTNHYLNHTWLQQSLVTGADVILALEVGDLWGLTNTVPDTIARPSQRLIKPDCKVAAINADYLYSKSNMGDLERYFSPDLPIAAESEASLPALIDAVARELNPAQRDAVAARRQPAQAAFDRMRDQARRDATRGWDASPISTARLCQELWAQIRGEKWGLVSTSAFVSRWPQRLWDMSEHHHYIGAEGGYGVGYGAPAAVGAAIAHREAGRLAVNIQNDGDLMMQPGVLWTQAHHSIPMLNLMHNNRAWHQEVMHLQRMANRRQRHPDRARLGTTITEPNIDYAGMARCMGVWGEGPITDPAKLGPALARALAVVKSGKPALLDVVTQPR